MHVIQCCITANYTNSNKYLILGKGTRQLFRINYPTEETIKTTKLKTYGWQYIVYTAKMSN